MIKINKNNILASKNEIIELETLVSSRIQKNIHLAKDYTDFFKNGGVTIKEIVVDNMKIHAPDFKPLLTNGLNGSKKFVVELNNINGTYGFGAKDSDFRRANEKLITQLDLKDKAGNLIDRKLLDNYIDNKFTWHHHENIREMILLPRKIHSIQLKHWGATMIFDNTKNNPILRNKWETSLIYK